MTSKINTPKNKKKKIEKEHRKYKKPMEYQQVNRHANI